MRRQSTNNRDNNTEPLSVMAVRVCAGACECVRVQVAAHGSTTRVPHRQPHIRAERHPPPPSLSLLLLLRWLIQKQTKKMRNDDDDEGEVTAEPVMPSVAMSDPDHVHDLLPRQGEFWPQADCDSEGRTVRWQPRSHRAGLRARQSWPRKSTRPSQCRTRQGDAATHTTEPASRPGSPAHTQTSSMGAIGSECE
jgi:hypothetical protein